MRKCERFRIKTIEFFVVYLKLDVPSLSLSGFMFFLYKSVNGVYSKTDVPPLSLSGFSPTTQIRTIFYKNIHRSWGRQSALA